MPFVVGCHLLTNFLLSAASFADKTNQQSGVYSIFIMSTMMTDDDDDDDKSKVKL